MERLVRAILIDPFAKTVDVVVLDANNYREINRLIDAEHFDVRGLGHGEVAYVDDTGLYRAGQAYFAMGPERHWPGKTLITGVDERGYTVETTLPLDRLRQAVRFYALQPVFRDITSTTQDAVIFGRKGTQAVFTAHFDPDGLEEKQ